MKATISFRVYAEVDLLAFEDTAAAIEHAAASGDITEIEIRAVGGVRAPGQKWWGDGESFMQALNRGQP